MLNLGRLRLLHELSLLGTISAVADAVHLTRSAVSKQLALLEDELQTVLVVQSGRGVQLTPAGRRLVARAVNLFEMVESIEAELASANVEISGEVSVCAFGSFAANVMPLAVRGLLETHPQLDVVFTWLEPSEGLRAAAARQADIAIVDDLVSAEPHANALEFRPLGVDRFDAVVFSNHSLAGRKSIQLSDLAHDRWAWHPLYGNFFMNVCLAAGFTPKVAATGTNQIILEMIRNAGVVAMLTELSLRQAEKDPDFKVLPIKPTIARNIFAALPKGSAKRPAIAAVLNALTYWTGRLTSTNGYQS